MTLRLGVIHAMEGRVEAGVIENILGASIAAPKKKLPAAGDGFCLGGVASGGLSPRTRMLHGEAGDGGGSGLLSLAHSASRGLAFS
jgi:hypothetical protein